MTDRNTITQTEIIIDGCQVPAEIYRSVKQTARSNNATQFIGVAYKRPQRPPIKHPYMSEPWWEEAAARSTEQREDMLHGKRLEYILGSSREELLNLEKLATILWVSPS